ncbi:biotin--[acetyl-CoA-carboxylase] ligase [Frankia sp. AgKG'84/4]|uniref:biotin--[acetyl-CoA-carboxylase] ligase n=1 Tax=Frankia sp. AgKG'84/4 TaxID=573490 RepID=UPI00200BF961|nr:biotin--[acetyl-CoA-carboxylase] ligase [Frankia sp. AgKG'84/4]MCL9793409.1 biotin--[acetyl-CoA-carboxylase] ligase [Frankia sp. AgKG'84/4]
MTSPSGTSSAGTPALPPEPSDRRGPFDAARLTALASAAGLDVAVVSEIDSTNAALARAARAVVTEPGVAEISRRWHAGGANGATPRGQVLVAERQSAGRGRLDRSWLSRPGAGLTASLLLRPSLETARLGWLPMVVGTSLATTVQSFAGLPAVLKWPNDVLVDGAKLAGILTELVPAPVPASVVVGFGLNVLAEPDELPERSTSLLQLGAPPVALDRTGLLGRILGDLVTALAAWEADPGQARAAYLARCATVGRQVRLMLPGGTAETGTATDVDHEGRLIVDGRAYSAADVVHLR